MSENIKCPRCGNIIDISQALDSQVKAKFAKQQEEFQIMVENKNKEFIKEFDRLKKEKQNFEEKVKLETEKALQQEILKRESEIKFKLESENLAKFELLQKELKEKSQKISQLNLQTAQIEQLKRKNSELQAEYKAKSEIIINERLKDEVAKITKNLSQENELKFRQKDDELNSLKKQIDELKRKSEITSQQLTGETQELAIEEWLATQFPLDTIEEVKKGANGADCMQIVNTRQMLSCGKIYYESKRTKSFQKNWIEKFKADMRDKGADVGILVTQSLPSELERVGLIDGIWVCTFTEFKGLCAVVRQGVIDIAHAKAAVENRGGKMQMLYTYLTGNEFKMQVEAIVEAFVCMQEDLDSEKRSMQRIWKSREKQIEKARDNAISMYASIRGIAGNAVSKINTLELGHENKRSFDD